MLVPLKLIGDRINYTWSSGISWKDTWQECKKCNRKIYPFNQEELICKTVTKKSIIPHDFERCGKCAELKYDCSKL